MKENKDKNQTVDEQIPCSGIQRSNLKNIYKQAKEKNAERIQKNSKPKHRNSIKVTTHHKELVKMLRLLLDESRTLIIAIDGVDDSRKSTLAHYLGWQLSMSAIETDLCRKVSVKASSSTAEK